MKHNHPQTQHIKKLTTALAGTLALFAILGTAGVANAQDMTPAANPASIVQTTNDMATQARMTDNYIISNKTDETLKLIWVQQNSPVQWAKEAPQIIQPGQNANFALSSKSNAAHAKLQDNTTLVYQSEQHPNFIVTLTANMTWTVKNGKFIRSHNPLTQDKSKIQIAGSTGNPHKLRSWVSPNIGGPTGDNTLFGLSYNGSH